MMNKKNRLVIFDLDGTLLDTSKGIMAAVKYSIDQFGLKELSDKELQSFIGPPIQDSFAKAYGLSGDILQDIATVFRDRYKNVDLLKAVPYDGIFDALAELKKNRIKLAVATYKREDYALQILKYFGFDLYFDIMHGADHYNRLKKADIVLRCIQEAGIENREEVILVGDTENDEIGARNAGINFLGVTYGFGYKDPKSRQSGNAVGFAGSPWEAAEMIIEKG